MYLTPVLEFCRDPLSDSTPTWTDVTSYLLEAEWSTGISRELDRTRPIDAAVALALAVQGATIEQAGSVYDWRGLITV
jgi:hypothetical protein